MFAIKTVKMCTKSGFTLLEIILGIILLGIIIGGLIVLFKSVIKETSPKAIKYENKVYDVAPSTKAAIAAFDFHQKFLFSLRNVETCLCFGGDKDNKQAKNYSFPLNNNFTYGQLFSYAPLIKGKLLNIRNLIDGLEGHIETYFENNATNLDLTCVLLNRDTKMSVFVQLRSSEYFINYDTYHLYSVVMYSVEDAKELKSYRFAVKASEDSYARCDIIKRFFYGNSDNRRESFDIIVFPDPYFIANNEKSNLQSLSRFTYILDAF